MNKKKCETCNDTGIVIDSDGMHTYACFDCDFYLWRWFGNLSKRRAKK